METLIASILISSASPLPDCPKKGWAIFIPGDQTILTEAIVCQRDFPDSPGTIIGGHQRNFANGEEAQNTFLSVRERHPDARLIYDSNQPEG